MIVHPESSGVRNEVITTINVVEAGMAALTVIILQNRSLNSKSLQEIMYYA